MRAIQLLFLVAIFISSYPKLRFLFLLFLVTSERNGGWVNDAVRFPQRNIITVSSVWGYKGKGLVAAKAWAINQDRHWYLHNVPLVMTVYVSWSHLSKKWIILNGYLFASAIISLNYIHSVILIHEKKFRLTKPSVFYWPWC